MACAAGFFAAYATLEPKFLEPKSYWHWLPWAGLVTALVNPIFPLSKFRLAERCVVLAVLAATAAWFLTPTWAKLQPPRQVYVATLGAAMFVTSTLLEPLGRRVGGVVFTGALSMAAFGGAALVGAFVSLRFGLLAGALGAVLVAATILAWQAVSPVSVSTLVPFYAVILWGLMVAVQTSEMLPPECYLLIPAAPLALWLLAVGPLLRRDSGWLSVVSGSIVVAIPIAIALGRAAWVMRMNEGY